MAKPFDRRKFLAGSAAAAGAIGLGMGLDLGLEDLAEAARSNGPGRNGITTAKPKRGGTLVFGVDAEEQGFNPSTARFDEVGVMYARTVFDPLTIITPSGGWAPYLAESVVPNATYSQWTITVRPNVLFHDGTPCDGAALLTNFLAQYNSLLVGPVIQPVMDKLPDGKPNMSQTGPLSVQLTFNQPWIPFPYYLAGQIGGQIGYIAAPSMLNAKNGGTDHPIGTGPFKFVVWDPDNHFTAVRNPNYWRKNEGLPYLDAIEFRPITDAQARSEALQSGSIDMMITDTPQVIVQYRGDRQWSYIDDSGPIVGEPDMNCVLLNLMAEPFSNPNVRLAAAKALSSAQYSKVIDIGVNAPTNGLFVPNTPYYSATGYPAYDPAGARALVKQVEQQTGKPVSFSLATTGDPEAVRAATFMQSRFEAVGMRVTTPIFQQNELINNALSGTFQANSWRQFGAVNPDMNYIFWSSTTVGASLSINMARNSDPIVQQALEVGRQNPNPAARVKAYQTVNKRFAVDLPYLWNDRAVWAVVSHPNVQNWNNPTTPNGKPALGMFGGSVWPTQIWLT